MPIASRLRRPCLPCGKAKISKGEDEKGVVEVTWKGAKIMSDKSVIYAMTGFEPPPELEGYTRDPHNPWRFIPDWPKCQKRIQTPLVKQCGAVTILSVCAHPKCDLRQMEVSVSDCEGCPFRTE